MMELVAQEQQEPGIAGGDGGRTGDDEIRDGMVSKMLGAAGGKERSKSSERREKPEIPVVVLAPLTVHGKH